MINISTEITLTLNGEESDFEVSGDVLAWRDEGETARGPLNLDVEGERIVCLETGEDVTAIAEAQLTARDWRNMRDAIRDEYYATM